jgi:uncharacterized protein (TIGR01777 family)
MMKILIVGGTGFIGQALQKALDSIHVPYKVLSRTQKSDTHVFWDPSKHQLDHSSLGSITHIINLAGAGIADQRWSKNRKEELKTSRIDSTEFLYAECSKHCPKLIGYIGISGVNAFGFKGAYLYNESHPSGDDFLSQLVAQWEQAHRLFEQLPSFSIFRLGMVLSSRGGAYRKIAAPMKFYLGAVPGSGQQLVPWVHLDDVIGLTLRVLQGDPLGLIHVVSENSSMRNLTKTIAKKERSVILLPNIPSPVIRLIFGEMGLLLTESIQIDHTKLTQSGYTLRFNNLSDLIYEKEN